jgi:hypothetical protein
MFEAEGEGAIECMRILRHETGHAVSHAYQLYKSKEWSRIFGKYNAPYPRYYSPDPASKNYVVHLNAWYAQAHPVEDFAETFAVWLNPGSRWKKRYRGWPALEKLNYIDRVMNGIRNREPVNKSTDRYQEMAELNYTVGTYYKRKKKFYALEWPEPYDRRLSKIFHNGMVPQEAAAAFLRKIRKEIRTHVSEGLDVPPYTVDQLILNMMRRCKQLNLKRAEDPHDTLKKILVILSAQLSNYIQSGYHKIPL